MSKKVWTINKNIDSVKEIVKSIINESVSANLTDEETSIVENVKNIIQVYERYSRTGGNRVSLTVNLIGNPKEGVTKVIGISAGGSTGVFFKANKIGENSFLNSLDNGLSKYR